MGLCYIYESLWIFVPPVVVVLPAFRRPCPGATVARSRAAYSSRLPGDKIRNFMIERGDGCYINQHM